MQVGDDFEWIIYVRISDDREGGGLGVKRQEQDGRELAARLGGHVLAVCDDNDLTAHDKSGRYKKRPEYERMCGLLRERPGQRGVIAWHSDRLHRTPTELEAFIVLVEQTGAAVQTVQAGELDLSTASGRMTARVHCAVARHESEHKSERVRRKVKELADAGAIYGGGPRPFGYNRIYSGDGPRRKILRDEINEPEAVIVRECARRLLAGHSVRSVVNWLNETEVKTSTGGRWSKQGLRFMMRAGRIAGLREHHDQVVSKAVWPAIIDRETHEQLRALLDSHDRPPGSRVRLHYLSGFVFCSACVDKGVKMRVNAQRGELKYKCPPDDGCNGRTVGLKDLEDMVDKYMVGRLATKEFNRELAARTKSRKNETRHFVDAIESDERRMALLRGSLTDGSEEELPEVLASVRAIRRRIDNTRAELARLVQAPSPVAGAAGLDLAGWRALDLDAKRSVLGFCVERIVVGPAVRGLARFDARRIDIQPWPRQAT
ncbi:MAG: recombinase family protein [Actinomycetota bacterium]|nr:recombinase family protein [Actinomycetota bacterium]